MVATARHRYTFEEYLAVEAASREVRHEFLGGDIFAMAGGTPEHAALAAAVLGILSEQLRGKPCRPYSSDLRRRVLATGLATYADASVVCDPLERDPASSTHVTNPVLVVEVLSPSTVDYDRGEKREHYQRIPSLRVILLVASDGRRVELFVRHAPGADFERHELGADGEVRVEGLGVRFGVAEVYERAGL